MRKTFLTFVFLVLCPWLAAQAMNNDSVIKMAKAGLSDDIIISAINSSAGTYDTSANGLIALKSAKISDRVIQAVMLHGNAPAPAPAPAPLAAPVQAAPVQVQMAPPAPQGPQQPYRSMDGKIRIYVTDHPISESTSIGQSSANRHGESSGSVSHSQEGDDPRTVEIQADIQKVCPHSVIVSFVPERADYVLVFRRQGGSRSSMYALGGLGGLAMSAAMKVNGASLFDASGDMVFATKQNSVEKTVKDICDHIPGVGALAPPPAAPAPTATPAPAGPAPMAPIAPPAQ